MNILASLETKAGPLSPHKRIQLSFMCKCAADDRVCWSLKSRNCQPVQTCKTGLVRSFTSAWRAYLFSFICQSMNAKWTILAHIKARLSTSETYRWIKVKASIYLSALWKTDYSKCKLLPWFPRCPNRGFLSAAAFALSRLSCQSGHWWTAYLARTNHIWLLSVTVNYTLCASCPPAAAQWQRSHLITTAEHLVCWCAGAFALSYRWDIYVKFISSVCLKSEEDPNKVRKEVRQFSFERKEKSFQLY